MKSALILPAPPIEKPETFPLLRKHKALEFVAMFESKTLGVIVNKNPVDTVMFKLGFIIFSGRFPNCFDEDTWEKLPEGTVVQLTV